MVVRFQGGNNAGHSVKIGEELFKLHHLPSGILRSSKMAVIGNGVVIDPGVLLGEVDGLLKRGKSVKNLRISERAHVIMPYHKLIDAAEEGMREGARVGTTGRGIGPAYADKAARLGIRMGELVDKDLLEERLSFLVPLKNKILQALGSDSRIDAKKVVNEYSEYGRRLRVHVTDTRSLLSDAIAKKKRVLLEGAQGTMLDIDHGTYPFVTSSNTVSGNVAAGSGIPATAIDEVFGVTKAYTTRVGEGPFPTELFGELSTCIAEKGREFGTTTGRNRRCGWLDLVVLRHAHALNGFSGLALTKVDVLGGLDEIRVCTHYSLDGRKTTRFPADLRRLKRCEPKYRVLEGWSDIEPKRMNKVLKEGFSTLPSNMRKYIRFVESEIGVRVVLLGLGRRRSETLDLRRRRW